MLFKYLGDMKIYKPTHNRICFVALFLWKATQVFLC